MNAWIQWPMSERPGVTGFNRPLASGNPIFAGSAETLNEWDENPLLIYVNANIKAGSHWRITPVAKEKICATHSSNQTCLHFVNESLHFFPSNGRKNAKCDSALKGTQQLRSS